MNNTDLIKLQEEINKADKKLKKLEAMEQVLYKQLKKDWKVSTIKAAKHKLKCLQEKEVKLEEALNKAVKKLEQKIKENEL